nr:hypothetical protein B0A51_12000 [Rachicladosporium sp. CCFEE 5018]
MGSSPSSWQEAPTRVYNPAVSCRSQPRSMALNGIPVVGRVFKALNETVPEGGLNGTIVGIPTLNPNGNIFNQRNFYSSSSNGFWTNLNRVMPGETVADGGAIADAYAYSIWNQVWGNLSNVDIAVDFR